MSRKALCIGVEMDIHAVTCPGVWLCPNGKVVVFVSALKHIVRTKKLPPVFPLLYHEKFSFRKTFSKVQYLTDLHNRLAKEIVRAELVQYMEGGDVLLATFKISLLDLLFPSSYEKAKIAGVDIDLLMTPSRCFPGIISPKIEISTKTTIDETVRPCYSTSLVNPKTLHSIGHHISTGHESCKRRQRKVCHSKACPKKKSHSNLYYTKIGANGDRYKKRPCISRLTSRENPCDGRAPFVVRHVDADIFNVQNVRKKHRKSKRQSKNKNGMNASPRQPLLWQSNSGRVYASSSSPSIDVTPDCSDAEKEPDEQISMFGNSPCVCEHPVPNGNSCAICCKYIYYFGDAHDDENTEFPKSTCSSFKEDQKQKMKSSSKQEKSKSCPCTPDRNNKSNLPSKKVKSTLVRKLNTSNQNSHCQSSTSSSDKRSSPKGQHLQGKIAPKKGILRGVCTCDTCHPENKMLKTDKKHSHKKSCNTCEREGFSSNHVHSFSCTDSHPTHKSSMYDKSTSSRERQKSNLSYDRPSTSCHCEKSDYRNSFNLSDHESSNESLCQDTSYVALKRNLSPIEEVSNVTVNPSLNRFDDLNQPCTSSNIHSTGAKWSHNDVCSPSGRARSPSHGHSSYREDFYKSLHKFYTNLYNKTKKETPKKHHSERAYW